MRQVNCYTQSISQSYTCGLLKIGMPHKLQIYWIFNATLTGFMSEWLSGVNSKRTCGNEDSANINVEMLQYIVCNYPGWLHVTVATSPTCLDTNRWVTVELYSIFLIKTFPLACMSVCSMSNCASLLWDCTIETVSGWKL